MVNAADANTRIGISPANDVNPKDVVNFRMKAFDRNAA